jgi:hypothetical protein
VEQEVTGSRFGLERVKGIEPSSSAWKAVALPLSYTRAREQISDISDHKQRHRLTKRGFAQLITDI